LPIDPFPDFDSCAEAEKAKVVAKAIRSKKSYVNHSHVFMTRDEGRTSALSSKIGERENG